MWFFEQNEGNNITTPEFIVCFLLTLLTHVPFSMGGFTLYLTVLASRHWPKVLRPASQLELTNGANSQNTISQQPKSSEDLRGFSLEIVVEFYFLIPNFFVFEGQTACQVWAKRGMNRPDFSEDSLFDFGQLDPKFDHLGMIGFPYGLVFLNTYNTNLDDVCSIVIIWTGFPSTIQFMAFCHRWGGSICTQKR